MSDCSHHVSATLAIAWLGFVLLATIGLAWTVVFQIRAERRDRVEAAEARARRSALMRGLSSTE